MRILQDLSSSLIFLEQADQLLEDDESIAIVRESFNVLMVVGQNCGKKSIKVSLVGTVPYKFD